MFYNKITGFWEDTSFVNAFSIGQKVLINGGGPYVAIRVEIVSIEKLGDGRYSVQAKEVK